MQEEPPTALHVIAWGFAVCFTACCALGTVQALQKGLTGFDLVSGLAQPLMFLSWALLSVSFATRGWAYLVRQSRLRSAAKGYWQPGVETIVVPLVEPQPIADASALALPTIILIRPHWRLHIPVYVALFILFMALLVIVWNSGGPVAPALAIAGGGFGCMVYAGIVALLATSASTSLVISEDGISLRQSGFTQRVSWDECKLFALVVGNKQDPAILGYELGGTRSSVRWPLRLRPTWHAFSEPELPFAVYDQQMRELIQLVAARTSLPLYDLR